MTITIGPGITIAAGVSITSPPGIVTNGLLLNFDAATYSGTGDWIDSANGVHATPYNNPTWSSDNGGTFVLSQPSAQYFTVPWPTFQPAYTIDIWFNLTDSQVGSSCLISDEFSGPFEFCIQTTNNQIKTGWYPNNWEGQFADNNIGAPFIHDGSTWYNITMAVPIATGYKDYINGTLSLDQPGTTPPNASSPSQRFFIGHRWDLLETVNAKMAVVNIYDRALTDAEVAQNFNYYRARFGI